MPVLRHSACLLCLSLAATACFDIPTPESDEGASDLPRLDLEAEEDTLVGQLLASEDSAVVGTVTFELYGASVTVDTNSQGVFRIALSEEILAKLPRHFSLVARAEDRVPTVVEITRPLSMATEGDAAFAPIYPLLEDLRNGERIVTPIEARVIHIGDDNYSGSANSQFQQPKAEASEISFTFHLDDEAYQVAGDVILEIESRGIETRQVDVILNQGTSPSTEVNPVHHILELGSTDGASTTEAVVLFADNLVPGENVVTIRGNLDEGDVDDFEMTRIALRSELEPGSCQDSMTGCDEALGATTRDIACMAALAIDRDALRIRGGYPDEPWGTLATIRKGIQAPGPFCYMLAGVASDPGATPLSLKDLEDGVSEQDRADYCDGSPRYVALEDFLLGSSDSVTVIELFEAALDICQDDMVQALALIAEVAMRHTVVDRANDPLLKKLAAPTDVDSDFYGQFYHWWGHLSLTYTYQHSTLVRSVFAAGTILYEFLPLLGGDRPDFGDLRVDASARDAGMLLYCLSDRYSRHAPPQASWWQTLGCDDPDRQSPVVISLDQNVLADRLRSPGCHQLFLRNGAIGEL